MEAERECFDINIFKLPNNQNYAALLEITCWRSVAKEKELSNIKRDINKLKEKGCPGFIIIYTVNHKDQTNGNIEFLSKGLGLGKNAINTFSVNKKPNTKFIILGFSVS